MKVFLLLLLLGCSQPALKKNIVRMPASVAPKSWSYQIERGVGVIVDNAGRMNLESHPYYVGKRKVAQNEMEFFFEGDIAIGELRNRIATYLHQNRIQVREIVAYLKRSRRQDHLRDAFYYFGQRVEMAALFTEIVMLKRTPANIAFDHFWDQNITRVNLGTVSLFASFSSWGMAYRTGGKLDDDQLIRTTLDAVEYRLQQEDFSRVHFLSRKRLPATNKSFDFADFDWSRLPIVDKSGELKAAIRREQKRLREEDGATVGQFLIDSGLYRTIIESVGITVP